MSKKTTKKPAPKKEKPKLVGLSGPADPDAIAALEAMKPKEKGED